MREPHVLRVEEGPERFAALFRAASEAGLRVGWLELAAASPLPEGLATAAALGVLRAVAASGGRSVAVKPLRGEPVLRDLLREHFRGCALVLVQGKIDRPRLEADGDAWIVRSVSPVDAVEGIERFEIAALVAALRKPRPWNAGAAAPP
ncbi:MAG TPA: hypothetical protein VOA87_07545 [Thermoanaerobaculia bacterium]|nr:hypothetical protein [Thermoanaerobaculia bacterium]